MENSKKTRRGERKKLLSKLFVVACWLWTKEKDNCLKTNRNIQIIYYSLIILVRMKLVILATASAQYEMNDDYDKNIRPSKLMF